MVKCDKRIVGRNYTKVCDQPIYKGTFCKFHYEQNINRNIPYKDRSDYKEPTLKELKSGIPLYLKHKPIYNGHKYRGGFIINLNRRNPVPTKYPANPELFMIKIKQ